MESRPHLRHPHRGARPTQLLFPEATSPLMECQSSPPTRTQLACSAACHPALLLSHIIAEWPSLVKRLGKRRQVLETVLKAGKPLRLTDDALMIGFPPDRRFHRELLELPDYRICTEEELARTFLVNLGLTTALYPDSRRRRHG